MLKYKQQYAVSFLSTREKVYLPDSCLVFATVSALLSATSSVTEGWAVAFSSVGIKASSVVGSRTDVWRTENMKSNTMQDFVTKN